MKMAPATVAGVEGEDKKKKINDELWQACAGPIVNLPVAGTHVVYFPQGHSEQVAASMKKDVDAQIPNYPNLPPKLLCVLRSITLHADPETDEVYAQMTLQPVASFDKDALLRSDLSMKAHKPQTEFFCKTLTASDTSTHGGFSVPRRAAEKIFPPLDFTMQPPAQELVARDLHDNVWTFRHIYRGQPKRHLLTTGWSLFVSGKRLFAGDSVLFIRDDKQQLLLGIRRANRQPANLSSSVLSSDSMHIGILAAAAHAAANNSPFSVFYNPRASPSEFVIPLAKYYKAVCSSQLSLGMRFRMMFETEEAGTRRYMGTITGISDLDPVRWKNSQWRNLQVGWDESTAGERRNRVSVWEIESVTAPFFICPTPPFFRSKRPRVPGMPDDDTSDLDSLFKRTMPWLGDDMYTKDPQSLPGLSLVQWMNMQQTPQMAQPNYMNSLSGSVLQNLAGTDPARQLGLPAPQMPMQTNIQFNAQMPGQQQPPFDQLQKLQPSNLNALAQVVDTTQHTKQSFINQNLPSSQIHAQIMQSQGLVQAQNSFQQQQQQQQQQQLHQQQQQQQKQQQLLQQQQQHRGPIQNQQLYQGLSQNFSQNLTPSQVQPDQVNQQLNMSDMQLQLMHKLQQQQQSILSHQSSTALPQMQDQQRQILDTSQSFSRATTPTQLIDLTQATTTALSQPHFMPQQIPKTSSQTNIQFSHPSQQMKFQPQPQPQQQQHSGALLDIGENVGLNPLTNYLSTAGGSLLNGTGAGGISGVTDDIPSCSTSPSTNNGPNYGQPNMNARLNRNTALTGEEMMSYNQIGKVSVKSDVKSSINISQNQSQGNSVPQVYATTVAPQIDYLESTSGTSVCLSQNDVNLHQINNPMTFNQQPVMFRDTVHHDMGLHGDPMNNSVQFGTNINGGRLGMTKNHDPLLTKDLVQPEKDFSNNLSSGDGVLSNYDGVKDNQPQLSSSMVSQSFGLPDMGFGSIDSTINDGSFMNGAGWAPAPQFQRMRTYTKVYKRGAVGRSIDMSRYAGYEELKQDLARMFGIEGQLEDIHRVGWKLVYVDNESDVLLVGDDPWEEFVSCVRCIKILSPQEVQAMSLDGDLGSTVLPNQDCSSSDGGNL